MKRPARAPIILKGDALVFMQQLWRLAHVLEVRSKKMAKTVGVTGPQRLVVRLLGQHANLTAREIAATLGMHPSTLSGILQRLQDQKLIVRTVDPKDRRCARFVLGPKGVEIDRHKRGTVEESVRKVLLRVSTEQMASTTATLAALVAGLVDD